MSTRFFTNRRDNTLIEKFAGVFANNPDILFFDALVAAVSALESEIDHLVHTLYHLTPDEIEIVEGAKQ